MSDQSPSAIEVHEKELQGLRWSLQNEPHPLHWLIRAFSARRARFNICVCGYAKGVCDIRPSSKGIDIHAMVVRDVYITDLGCEEENRCLNRRCAKNRTDVDSFNKNHHARGKDALTQQQFEGLVKRGEELQHFVDQELPELKDEKEPQILIYKKAPLKLTQRPRLEAEA